MDFYCKYPECEVLKQRLDIIPKFWDGKKSILELKENNFQWRQIEWIGFWFEYWCKNNLSDIMEIPYHNKIKNVTFDAFWKFPWDFKTHAINNGRYVIVNACSAIEHAISEFGYFGLVIVKGTANMIMKNGVFAIGTEISKEEKPHSYKKRGKRKLLKN